MTIDKSRQGAAMKAFPLVVLLGCVPSLLSAQTVSPKCEGNLLATALPPAREVGGYKAVAVQCVRGQATKNYEAGDSSVSVQLVDAEGTLAGKVEANDPQQIVDMAKNMGRMLVNAARANADGGRGVIEGVRENPSSVAARGGPEYVPFMMPMPHGELIVLVPTKEEASGDFIAQGASGPRYMVAFDIKQALAGKDAKAARATIEPFLRLMDFSKLP
jgi:hypothetical protein